MTPEEYFKSIEERIEALQLPSIRAVLAIEGGYGGMSFGGVTLELASGKRVDLNLCWHLNKAAWAVMEDWGTVVPLPSSMSPAFAELRGALDEWGGEFEYDGQTIEILGALPLERDRTLPNALRDLLNQWEVDFSTGHSTTWYQSFHIILKRNPVQLTLRVPYRQDVAWESMLAWDHDNHFTSPEDMETHIRCLRECKDFYERILRTFQAPSYQSFFP